MKQRSPRSIIILIIMILFGIGYLVLLNSQEPLTGSYKTDGIVSVLAGLYFCSHPAANGLDVLLYRRYMLHRKTSHSAEITWWALNLAVLLTGWWVMSVGIIRFSM